MSLRAAIGVTLGVTPLIAALMLSCGGGHRPPRATLGPDRGQREAIRFEDLPVTRVERSQVPRPNAANPSLGAPNAPVVIQLWSDFQCPYCADAHPVLKEVLRSYAGKVRLVWRDYPLPFHAHARLAANAGREAFAQGGSTAFWKFHDAVYAEPDPELDGAGLERFASKAGLDAARFRAALNSARHDAEINQDVHVADSLGVSGTPAFLVNDYFFVGAVPLDVLCVIVDRALADAGT